MGAGSIIGSSSTGTRRPAAECAATPQFDVVLRQKLGLNFDPFNLPAGQFLAGGEAWRLCRAGRADPASFGISVWWGAWFVRNNVVRDLAALNKLELLPWDSWGLMDRTSGLGDGPADQLVDEVAAATSTANWAVVRRLYAGDDRLGVPDTLPADQVHTRSDAS